MFAKTWVQYDQGGAVGLAFELVDGFFFVIRVFGIVVECSIVWTYARTSNVTNSSDERVKNTTNKQTMIENKILFE